MCVSRNAIVVGGGRVEEDSVLFSWGFRCVYGDFAVFGLVDWF